MENIKNNKKRKLRGSGILVVIFATVATSIYMISTFADYEHFDILEKKYENQFKLIGEKRIESIDEYYNKLENEIKTNENYILE